MGKTLILVVSFALLVIVPVSAYGATFKIDRNYNLNSGVTVNDNLYVAGSDVNIAGIVSGDLFVAGGNVIVSGPVSADLFAAGGALNISGNVAGDMRLAGGSIFISNSVGGELLVVGGQVNIVSGFSVSKDVKIVGGNVHYNGNTDGSVVIKGGQVYINGTVGKNLSVKARNVTLGPGAVIKGNFDYYSPKEVAVEPGAKVLGATNFHKIETARKMRLGLVWGLFTILWLLKVLMLITAALVMLYFGRNHVKALVRETSSSFFKEAGRGFVLFVVMPVAVIISFITVVGAALGLIAILTYFVFVITAGVLSALVFADLVIKRVFQKVNYELNWWIVILAVLTICLINLIPIIGWVFNFIIFLAALGGLTGYIYKKL